MGVHGNVFLGLTTDVYGLVFDGVILEGVAPAPLNLRAPTLTTSSPSAGELSTSSPSAGFLATSSPSAS